MEYRINDKKVRIFPQHLEKISDGNEGIVYKYYDKVLKLYHTFPKKSVLSFKDCNYMSQLTTHRILLPDSSVCDKKHHIKGYVISPFIEETSDIYQILGRQFLEERERIEQELIYLGEHFVSIADFTLDNFRCADHLYCLDPGSYEVHWDMMDEDMEKNIIYLTNVNIEYFNAFLLAKIFQPFIKKYTSNLTLYRNVCKEILLRCEETLGNNQVDYIAKYILPDEPLEESIKRLVRVHAD